MKASDMAGESVGRMTARLDEVENEDMRFVSCILLLQMRLNVDILRVLERIEGAITSCPRHKGDQGA